MLPGGQNEPEGQGEQVLGPLLLAVENRPAVQDEGGEGVTLEGGLGVAGAGAEGLGLGEEGMDHTKGQPCGHHTMGQPLVSRPYGAQYGTEDEHMPQPEAPPVGCGLQEVAAPRLAQCLLAAEQWLGTGTCAGCYKKTVSDGRDVRCCTTYRPRTRSATA